MHHGDVSGRCKGSLAPPSPVKAEKLTPSLDSPTHESLHLGSYLLADVQHFLPTCLFPVSSFKPRSSTLSPQPPNQTGLAQQVQTQTQTQEATPFQGPILIPHSHLQPRQGRAGG